MADRPPARSARSALSRPATGHEATTLQGAATKRPAPKPRRPASQRSGAQVDGEAPPGLIVKGPARADAALALLEENPETRSDRALSPTLSPAASAAVEATEEQLRQLIWQLRPELLRGNGPRILFTRNASRLVSLRYDEPSRSCTLRVHLLFLAAPVDVLEAIVLAFFGEIGKRDARALRAFIMDYVDHNRDVTLATTTLPRLRSPQGAVYDLDALRQQVVRCYVPERQTAERSIEMGWSLRPTPSLMGKWIETPAHRPNRIAVNSLLDDADVPKFYLEYIVFHEILHDIYPIRRQGGRWVLHCREFRRRERSFPLYEEACRWEREQLPALAAQKGLERRTR